MNFIWLMFFSLFQQENAFAAEAKPRYPIQCQNMQDCPEWVLGLTYDSRTSQGMINRSVCSGSLVGPDVVLTNLHCLPEELKSAGQSCHNIIQISFPQTSSLKSEVAECDRVLAVSPPLNGNHLRLDYAFLKLKNSPRRTNLGLAHDGISDQSELQIFKVNPVQEKGQPIQGVVQKIICPAVQYSLLNPYFIADRAPLVTVGNCEIVKGNSGSALVGSDGLAHGVINSVTEFSWTRSLQEKYKVNLDKMMMAFGTNMSCIPDLQDLANEKMKQTASVCDIHLDESTRNKLNYELIRLAANKSIQKINETVNGKMKELIVDPERLFFWKAEQVELDEDDKKKAVMAKVVVQPACLLPQVKDVEKYASKLKNADVTFQMKSKSFLIKEKMDSFLRYQTLTEEETWPLEVVLNPKLLVQRKNIPVSLTVFESNQKKIEKKSMNTCYQPVFVKQTN